MIPVGGDSVSLPKYAHVERERRWLIDTATRPALDGLRSVRIEDRYLDGGRLRLRRVIEDGIPDVMKLTKKYDCADPLARPIVTAYLTDSEYATLAELPGKALIKRRFKMPLDGHLWCGDVFEGGLAGLELLEVEMMEDAALRAIYPPSWATPEVSNDVGFQGGSLAAAGIPEE